MTDFLTAQELIFVAMFLTLPVLAFGLHRLARVDFLSISIPSILFVSTMIFAYVGIIVLYFQWDPYRVRLGIVDQRVIERMLLYSGGVLVGLGLGCLAASQVKDFRIMTAERPSFRLRGPTVVTLFLVIAACAAIVGRYLQMIGEIPLVVALSEGATAAAASRYKATTGFANYQWCRVVFDSVIPFAAFIALAHAIARKKMSTWTFALAVIGFAGVVSVMQIMKSKIVLLMIGLVFTWILQKGRRLNPFNLGLVGLVAIAVLIPLYQNFMGLSGRDLGDVAWAITMRTVAGQIGPAYFYLQHYPDYQDFLTGKSFPNPGGVLPYEPERITSTIHGFMFQDPDFGAISEPFGTAPTVFWGEVYANFGPYLPFVTAIAIGALLYALNGRISQLRDTPLKSAFIAWLCIHYYRLSSTGIGVYIVDIDLFVVALVAAALYGIERLPRPLAKGPVMESYTEAAR